MFVNCYLKLAARTDSGRKETYMSNVNRITDPSLYTAGTTAYEAAKNISKTDKAAVKSTDTKTDETDKDTAVVYTPSSDAMKAADEARASLSKKTGKLSDDERASLVSALKAEEAEAEKQFQDMVKDALLSQGKTYNDNTNIWKVLQDPDFLKNVDQKTIDKAKEATSESGYYGVKKTSERILAFSKAVAGNDVSKADKMIEAFKKGYKEAEKIWGGKLPEISQKTYDAVMKGFDEWKKTGNSTEDTTDTEKADDKTTAEKTEQDS